MTVAIITFVKEENLSSILSEGFKPSERRRSYDRRKKEGLMNEVVGVDPETPIVYGIAVDDELADLGHIKATAALHGQVALVWKWTSEYKTSITCGDSLCGDDHTRALPFSYFNFLLKKKELLEKHRAHGRSVQTCYVEVQLRDPDIDDAEVVRLVKRRTVAEVMGEATPSESEKKVDIGDFL